MAPSRSARIKPSARLTLNAIKLSSRPALITWGTTGINQYGHILDKTQEVGCHWLCQCFSGSGIDRPSALAEPVAPNTRVFRLMPAADRPDVHDGKVAFTRNVKATFCISALSSRAHMTATFLSS